MARQPQPTSTGELPPSQARQQIIDEAKRLFNELAEAGVDYDDVTRVLEEEGVQKFDDSFSELLEGIAAKRVELAAA